MENNICLHCGNTFNGKFCNQCGEKVYTDHDRSFLHIFEEAFHFFTHFEGKFFNTLKAVLLRPGKLSTEYCAGLRKKYFKPISFFLLLVIAYLLFPVFEGLNMRVRFHKSHNLYGKYATEQVEKVMHKKNLTEEQLDEQFHHKGEKTSKFLLFAIIPFMALVSWGLGYRKRKYYFDHFIFSIEAGSMLILLVFLLLPALLVLLNLLSLGVNLSEGTIAIISLLLYSVYVGRMSHRFFGFVWWYNVVYSLVFISWTVFFLNYLYKAVLFYVTIHLV